MSNCKRMAIQVNESKCASKVVIQPIQFWVHLLSCLPAAPWSHLLIQCETVSSIFMSFPVFFPSTSFLYIHAIVSLCSISSLLMLFLFSLFFISSLFMSFLVSLPCPSLALLLVSWPSIIIPLCCSLPSSCSFIACQIKVLRDNKKVYIGHSLPWCSRPSCHPSLLSFRWVLQFLLYVYFSRVVVLQVWHTSPVLFHTGYHYKLYVTNNHKFSSIAILLYGMHIVNRKLV